MKSTISLIDRGILFNDLKRSAWIGAGYLLGMFVSVPLILLMTYSKIQRVGMPADPQIYSRIFAFDPHSSLLQPVLLILVPILTGLWLFQYLQDGKASDMMHALPVRREIFYNTHVLTGLIILFVPLIITALISWTLVAGLEINSVSGMNILTWLGLSLLFNLLFLITSVATGMVTGMSTVQGGLSLILLFLPTGLSWLVLDNVGMHTYGFAYDYYTRFIEVSPC